MMSNLLAQINPKIHSRFVPLYKSGERVFALQGGRRSGKTWYSIQRAITRVMRKGAQVNVASMTAEQGRLGAYADACTIIRGTQDKFGQPLEGFLTIGKSPREIRCDYSGGRVFFNSYQNSETAKGIACDDLFVNEANNFTYQQVIDLMASVRDTIIFDFNQYPEWLTQIVPSDNLIRTTWRDNPYLTDTQVAYFHKLKENAEKEGATAVDIYLYRVYYLGEPAEIIGTIFTPLNIHRGKAPERLHHILGFLDPSDMRGADYFAGVIGGTDGEKLYILDAFSYNEGQPDMILRKIEQWRKAYEVENIYIERNGSIGQRFFEYATNSIEDKNLLKGWWSKGKKFERITGNYYGITGSVVFGDTPEISEYLQQVYEFDSKCEHDDNIDAVSSLYDAFRWYRYIKL